MASGTHEPEPVGDSLWTIGRALVLAHGSNTHGYV